MNSRDTEYSNKKYLALDNTTGGVVDPQPPKIDESKYTLMLDEEIPETEEQLIENAKEILQFHRLKYRDDDHFKTVIKFNIIDFSKNLTST
jgi:hypothetical protein